MLTIRYISYSSYNVYPDREVFNQATRLLQDYLIQSNDMEVITGQALLIDAFRVLVKQQFIKPNDICFTFNNTSIKIDENGRLDKWPTGFCDVQNELTEVLLE